VHAPLRPFNVWWTQHPLQAHLITGWSGGPPAIELLGDARLPTTAVHEMARVFGMGSKRAESLVDAMHVHDWTHDRYIRGAYAYPAIGGAYAARMLARSIEDTVFIAGEAADSGSGGTVEAAIASGKRAAQKILKTNQPG
jgi:monoamine oxidase